MSPASPVGVVGYGAIGSRMARRLMAAGMRVISFDIDPERQEAAQDDGAEPLEDAAAVGRICEIIITCVTDARAVLDCVCGAKGLARRIRTGALVIETTTSTPDATREAAKVLAERGASIVDAPVSRGVPAAENGTLSIMIGGTESDIALAETVLRHLGTDIIPTGPIGTGHIAKAMNMMVMAVNLLALAEAAGLGVSLGQDRAHLVESLNDSPAASFMTDNHYRKQVLTEAYASTFTLGLMLKDIRVATGIARGWNVAAPLGSRAEQIYLMAAARGLAPGDNMRIVPFVEDLAGSGVPSGPAGQGITDNLAGVLKSAALLSTLEAAVVGREAGLDVERLLKVVNVSSGASTMSRALVGEAGGDLPQAGALIVQVARAVELARARRIALPVCSTVFDMLCLVVGGARDGRLQPNAAYPGRGQSRESPPLRGGESRRTGGRGNLTGAGAGTADGWLGAVSDILCGSPRA